VANTVDFQISLLNRARTMTRAGLHAEARPLLEKLISNDKTPTATRCEALRLSANIELEAGRFKKARRALREVARLTPKVADVFYRLAKAFDDDPKGNPRKSVLAMRNALQIEPENPDYWAFYGVLCIRSKLCKSGLLAIRKAMKLAPCESGVLEESLAGLVHLGRTEEAKVRLMRARFRRPKDAELTRLWNRFRFDEAANAQRAKSTPNKKAMSFPTLAPEAKRADGASPFGLPHLNAKPRVRGK
jgi:tetratricopeptide (TPR) repeat protein